MKTLRNILTAVVVLAPILLAAFLITHLIDQAEEEGRWERQRQVYERLKQPVAVPVFSGRFGGPNIWEMRDIPKLEDMRFDADEILAGVPNDWLLWRTRDTKPLTAKQREILEKEVERLTRIIDALERLE